MEIAPENEGQENKPNPAGTEKDNEELAKEIPTVTPDNDNDDLEPNPSQEEG